MGAGRFFSPLFDTNGMKIHMSSSMQQGYYTAIEQAVEIFAKKDPGQMAFLSGGEYLPAMSMLEFSYLHETYEISWPAGTVRNIATGEVAAPAISVLLLNYLTSANGQRPLGNLIAIRDIPGAASYEDPFNKRATNPLVKSFDGKGDMLLSAAIKLGGSEVKLADVAIALPILPLLTVTYAIWHVDEEFAASGTILFDSSAKKLLPVECLVVAAANGVYALIKASFS